jgi:hypothetical protein
MLGLTCGKPVENPSAKRTTVLSEPCGGGDPSLISGAIRYRISLMFIIVTLGGATLLLSERSERTSYS